MVTQQKRIFVLSFLALFALIFSFSITMAQTPATTSQVEIIGVVEAMDTNSITVNQQVIDVTNAEIKLPLAIGTAVKVEGTINSDGTISAREVIAPDAVPGGMLPGEVEITGLLTALDSTTMTVGGQTFDISSAEIKTGVVVGEIVKVHATLSSTGVWVAREVGLAVQNTPGNINDNNANANNANDNNANQNDNNANANTVNFDQGEMELTGTLTAVASNSITVAGQTIDTTNAEIKGTLVVGALVKVHVSMVNGQVVAREVELIGQSSNGNGNNGAIVLPPNCVATQPTGWTTYTIQAGDTLSSIADRSNGSVSEIAVANCISDPRLIVAGMSIFVPQQPVSVGNQNSNDNGGRDDNLNSNDNHGNDNQSGDNHNSNDNQGGNDHGSNGGNDNQGGDNGGHGNGNDNGTGHG